MPSEEQQASPLPSADASRTRRRDPSYAGQAHADAASSAIAFQGLLGGLRRQHKLITACTLLGLAAGCVVALLPRHYTAVSRIQVRPGSSSQYRVSPSDLLNLGDDSTKLETETMILESDTLLLDIARTLHLDQDKDFMGWFAGKPDEDGPKAEERLLAKLHANIHATRIPRTEIMQISCNTKSRLLSARIVNTLVAEYIQRLFESRFSSTQRVTKWLSAQLDDLKQQVESDQEKLIQLQSRLGIVGLDQNHDIIVTELEDLTKAADEARVERIIAEARFRILSGGELDLLEGGQDLMGHSTPASSQLSLLANLRNQKAQTEARFAGLNAQFGPKYPEVQQATAELATVNREIQQEQARVLNQAHQAFDAASTDEQKTFATLTQKKSQAFTKQNEMVQYQILLHDYESSRSLYEGLMQRLRQAGIVAGLESSEVDIVDMARVPGKPSELGRAATIVLGTLFGFAGGLAAAVMVVQFDQRLEDLTMIESQLGMPLLSITMKGGTTGRRTVPGTKSLPDGVISNVPEMFQKHPNSPFVESMWSLRTSLLLSSPGKIPQTILFTSCNMGEGKSTIAAAQACALALRNASVLLIDGDLRRPTIARRMDLRNGVGLSSILSGKVELDSAVQAVEGVPNLWVLSSGATPPSAALLLASDTMSQLMETLKQRYDFIVMDSPPLLGLVDSSVLAQFADAVVLVLSYQQLHKLQIKRAGDVLRRVGRSVAGIALNFADQGSLGDYGYGYESGYNPAQSSSVEEGLAS